MSKGDMAFPMRCQALDSNGDQCETTAATETNYHGSEIYDRCDDKVTWVRVAFCLDHDPG